MGMEEIATLGAGCYWCLEAFYQRVKGVSKVESGYSGGHVDNPTTNRVYMGDTGHAEVVQVTFDPQIITYKQILEIFYVMHNPTTLNKQDYDSGPEYRSIILYRNEQQKAVAEDMTKNFAPTVWPDPIVTELVPFEKFWPADEYMQSFYNKNPQVGYCMVIIDPKLQKLRQKLAHYLK